MTTTESTPLKSGVITANFDNTVRPQDDLFRHVNGTWMKNKSIPADKSDTGAFRVLIDGAEKQVKEIILEAANGTEQGEAGKIRRLYNSFMNEDAIELAGVNPLEADFQVLDAASSEKERAFALGLLERTGAAACFGSYVDTDLANPNQYAFYFYQGGLGLPDEAYYREDDYQDIRAAYLLHIEKMLRYTGRYQGEEAETAKLVLELERKIAAGHWDVVKDRDSVLTFNPTPFDEFVTSAPGFDWKSWALGLQVPAEAFSNLVVREPSFFSHFANLWQSENWESWQAWFSFHIVSSRAGLLSKEIVDASFDFYGRTLNGTEVNRDRWKRAVSLVEGSLGEAVGKIYVQRHFPASHKERINQLVENLIEAYRVSIANLDWLSPETKERALEKLAAFTPKIGYPDKWRDYSDLEIPENDIVAAVRAIHAFEVDFEFAKIGKEIDRDEWHMTPQTVNAYYNPGMNEIVFPAAILQPPFFDPEAEDAVNYGGIGAVIGHEIGHGFDDQGSKYDGTGKLVDWWEESDRLEFEKRANALIAQYNELSPTQLADDQKVNGALTVGENIGDLGGLTIAILAYQISLGGKLENAAEIDGFSGIQRLLISWAQVWQIKIRDESAIQRLATDPHSPAEFRCNAVVSNIDEFYQAFNVNEGDELYLAPEKRVHIWR